MNLFERRLLALEKPHTTRFLAREVFVVFGADEARVDAGSHRYERARRADEAPDDFQHRVMIEAGKFGSRLICMTQVEYDEIAARLEAEV
jgi:hypothetical protein